MKKARHEREKSYMDTMRGLGCAVGEYVGDGKGDLEENGMEQLSGDDEGVDDDYFVVEQSRNEEQ